MILAAIMVVWITGMIICLQHLSVILLALFQNDRDMVNCSFFNCVHSIKISMPADAV